MPRSTKQKKVVSRSFRTKKLCPHCGHDDFEVTESRFSWLLGQKFICAKCKGTFRKANLVRVREKSSEVDIRATSSSRGARGRRRR